MKLVSVQQKDLSVKESELSTAPCAEIQPVSNSGKDILTVCAVSHVLLIACYVNITSFSGHFCYVTEMA